MSKHWLNLDGRVCVVTGAAGGIGHAISLAFSEAGALPVLIDRPLDKAQQAASDMPGRSLALQCDVASEEEVVAAKERVIREFGRCDASSTMPPSCARKRWPNRDWRTGRPAWRSISADIICARASSARTCWRGDRGPSCTSGRSRRIFLNPWAWITTPARPPSSRFRNRSRWNGGPGASAATSSNGAELMATGGLHSMLMSLIPQPGLTKT